MIRRVPVTAPSGKKWLVLPGEASWVAHRVANYQAARRAGLGGTDAWFDRLVRGELHLRRMEECICTRRFPSGREMTRDETVRVLRRYHRRFEVVGKTKLEPARGR